MPNRILKESICTSEELASISAEAEVLFYRLIVKADDFGIYYANPKIIMGSCFPLTTPTKTKVEGWLDELCCASLITIYVAEDGKRYLKLVAWEKHQQRRASKSKFPLPIAIDILCKQPQSLASTCNHLHANVPVNENVNENVNEKRERVITKTLPVLVDGFNLFWTIYPKRVGKKDATKAWNQIKPDDAKVQIIIQGVERLKKSEQWTRNGGQYIPNPATFLRGERWDDEPTTRQEPSEKNYDDGEDFLGR